MMVELARSGDMLTPTRWRNGVEVPTAAVWLLGQRPAGVIRSANGVPGHARRDISVAEVIAPSGTIAMTECSAEVGLCSRGQLHLPPRADQPGGGALQGVSLAEMGAPAAKRPSRIPNPLRIMTLNAG
jgi:hypothetical protein